MFDFWVSSLIFVSRAQFSDKPFRSWSHCLQSIALYVFIIYKTLKLFCSIISALWGRKSLILLQSRSKVNIQPLILETERLKPCGHQRLPLGWGAKAAMSKCFRTLEPARTRQVWFLCIHGHYRHESVFLSLWHHSLVYREGNNKAESPKTFKAGDKDFI